MMRKFSSYGPIDTDLHYYVPRQALIDEALLTLVGEKPEKGGHYSTIWAPRQRGKTWIMEQVLLTLRHNPLYNTFAVVDMSLGNLRGMTDVEVKGYHSKTVPETLSMILEEQLPGDPVIKTWQDFRQLFSRKKGLWDRPLILLIDEADTTPPFLLDLIVGHFRELYLHRETNWLHGLALIGVRAVLGVDSPRGSPFNVQQSLHIPNLTFEEVDSMFHWYERESGQTVEQAVIDQVFYETNGQPGLVSWLGELLTVAYNKHNAAIVKRDFEIAYAAAVDALPNSSVINIISKAKQQPYKQLVLELFQTDAKLHFKYEKPDINFLYMNGVVDLEVVNETEHYLKFSCPFIQKKLFDYFSGELFYYPGRLYDPLDNLDDVFTPQGLHLPSLLQRYEAYLQQNSTWLFKDAPRRHDMRLYEAVYHFNLYKYLTDFLQRRKGRVWPEFPTGNGQVDVMIDYKGQIYGIEVKSFADNYEYKKALKQAANYAHQLHLTEITLLLFIEAIDDQNRAKYEAIYDDTRGIKVVPVFVVTGP